VGSLAGITIVQWGERQRALPKPGNARYSLSLKPFSSGAPFETGERGSLLLFSLSVP